MAAEEDHTLAELTGIPTFDPPLAICREKALPYRAGAGGGGDNSANSVALDGIDKINVFDNLCSCFY